MNATDPDLLIDRIVDRVATPDDCERLARIGNADPNVWSRLSAALDAERTLDAGAGALRRVATSTPRPAVRPTTWSRVATWSGWAAAAILVVVAVQLARPSEPVEPPASRAAVASDTQTLDDLWNTYVSVGSDDGRVLREYPPVTVSVRRLPEGGGTEVTYVRRVLERATVGDTLRLATDEHGRPVVVPVRERPAAPRQAL